ncbi:hypothetical protein [Lysinibacillus capsici]|uniref:hypothetical protein n=1 Tax=Lysinibacillus capsici TaxID=2115968 RepID=UPI002896503A|nr:hypothetical protein [Lysinibacillus capsici]
MLKQVYEVDSKGFIKEIHVSSVDENGIILDESKQDYISVDPLDILFSPQWNGTEWVEGETVEERAERESQQLLESLKPSHEEIANAELEIKMLTMLTELGVIQ